MADPTTQTTPTSNSLQPAKPRRRRWVKILLALFALSLVGVWFAPTIVAKTTLRNRFARKASADLNGTVDIGGASLGWFSPVELSDVTLTDSQGRVVARIPKITSSKTLFTLARDRSDLGEFTLDRPAVEVHCAKKNTNLEEVFRKLLDDATPPSATRSQVTVRVVDGSLILHDSETGRTGEFRDIDAVVSLPRSRSEPITIRISANVPGKLDAVFTTGSNGRVKLAARGVALESLAPLLRRLGPSYSIAGLLTADVNATWRNDAASIEGNIALDIANVRFRGAGLDIDEPRINAIADLTVDRKTGTTAFENFTINSAPLTVKSGRLVIRAPEHGELIVEGGGPSVVGLNRLGKMVKLYEDAQGSHSMHGTGTGPFQFRYSGGTTTFGGTLNIADFIYGPPTPGQSESTMRLEADGSYTELTDTLAFKTARVERAKLTPALCASVLGYALPVIFKAGKAEGEISIVLGDNRFPLADENKVMVKGQVLIHRATVTASPVIGAIAELLGANNATVTLANETTVVVRIENGRVYHQNLAVKVGTYTVATSGSVGFDGTLDLVAEVPITAGFPGLKGSPLLAKAVVGKRVQIPVTGTLAKPTLDSKHLKAALAKLAQDTAKDFGKDLLNKELEKLFPGMPGPKK